MSDYRAALDWLLSLPDWERGTGGRGAHPELLLERPAALLKALGHPERAYPAVIVAGTKGKGSTAAMLESMVRVAGLRTGLYTSPHLHTYRERIRVNGDLIPAEDFAAGVARLQPLVDELQSARPDLGAFTTFELMTTLALNYFAAQVIDLAILEVGLGGRLDATNVVNAQLALITTVSFDHMAVLGNTLGEIALEKAGIIKPGAAALTVPAPAEVLDVIRQRARTVGATLGVEGVAWTWSGDHADFRVQAPPVRELWEDGWSDQGLKVLLLGVHQLENAALAVAAAHALPVRAGVRIDAAAIRDGLAAAEWPGRIEVLQARGLARPIIVADGAHNGAAAAALVHALQLHFVFRRLWLVLAALGDKDLSAIVEPLLPLATHAWAVQSRHPRSRKAMVLAAELNALGLNAEPAVSLAAALAAARARAEPDDLICITGSLSVAAEAREVLGLAEQEP